jgi:hypothetical protein
MTIGGLLGIYGQAASIPNNKPIIKVNNLLEIENKHYSREGRVDSDGLTGYGNYRFTNYSGLMPSGIAGIPVVISVDDPDPGQTLKGQITVLQQDASTPVNPLITTEIKWSNKRYEVGAGTGIQGTAFIPLTSRQVSDIEEEIVLHIEVSDFENRIASSRKNTVHKDIRITVDTKAPIVTGLPASGDRVESIEITNASDASWPLVMCLQPIIAGRPVDTTKRIGFYNYDADGRYSMPKTLDEATFESLTRVGEKCRIWVEDSAGNKAATMEIDMTNPVDVTSLATTYMGYYEETTSNYSVLINARQGDQLHFDPEVMSFIVRGIDL